MPPESPSSPDGVDWDVLLKAASRGDPEASERLLELVYEELRQMARAKLARERPGLTLQATALVHEAWLKLLPAGTEWRNRQHFVATVTEAMRRILVDNARHRKALRHGGGLQRIDLDATWTQIAAPGNDDELLAVHEVLDRLARHDPRKAELVKLHRFVGLTLGEAAPILGIGEATAKRDWAYARAWLKRELLGL